VSKELFDAMINMREKDALRVARESLEKGEDPLKLLESCREAMDLIGNRFEKKEYFLPELVLAGRMLSEITEMAKPRLVEDFQVERIGKVVIGTVQGDIHNIGKNIVTFMLDVHGFEVFDLGVDVSPQRFVDAIEKIQPEVVGLSGLLTLAYSSMKNTVEAIEQAGLRDKVKIMIGGGAMNDEIREFAGADAYGPDAMAAVSFSKRWIEGR